MVANDVQIGGRHYAGAYQHWDFVADVLEGRYMEGQITKYVSRWRKKNGLQDLHKAEHFTNKLIELVDAGRITGIVQGEADAGLTQTFCTSNELGDVETMIITTLAKWNTMDDLVYVLRTLQYMTQWETA